MYSLSPEGKKSEIRVSAGPPSIHRLCGMTFSLASSMYLAKITQQGKLVDLILSDPKARERHLSGGGELGSIPHLRGELWTPGWLDLHAG